MHPNLLATSLKSFGLAQAHIDVTISYGSSPAALREWVATPATEPRRVVANGGVIRGLCYVVPFSVLIWVGLLLVYLE